ncbi:MAG: rhomboid family intramembrane serine protease [Bacteroidales bacterium]
MIYQQRNPMEEIGRYFRSPAILPRLILINIAIWLLIAVARVFSFLFNIPDSTVGDAIADYLALPAKISTLLSRPWTLATYMFLHISFFHILFNMLWLYWFGKIFQEFLRSKQLLFVYIAGGLSGGLLYILFYNVFPVFRMTVDQSVALGASASVMAIVTGIAVYVPGYALNMLLFGRVRIIYIAAILFVLDFFMIRSSNAGGHIAHIGGALFGLLFALSLRKGFSFKRVSNPFRRRRKTFRPGIKYPNERPLSDDEFNLRKAAREKRINMILEKIKKSGYESLSEEDKEILFRAGKK